MNWRDLALLAAGIIGGGTALVHGILTQRLMVRPIDRLLAERQMSAAVRRLVPMLLHFSTFAWFLGGLALVATAIWLDGGARLATGLIVGALFLFGAIGNCWGTRGRHPGWMLMAAACLLIGLALGVP